jgi:phosphoribosylformimino-5-aminoimidazole carboxamide ribonucleotide (ProFAR) isomerase
MAATVETLTARTSGALDALARVAEPIDDEWQYVTDLVVAWSARLALVGSNRQGEAAPAPVEAAVDRVIEEARLVTDPHRAIDWLSTLPQVVLVALDERG